MKLTIGQLVVIWLVGIGLSFAFYRIGFHTGEADALLSQRLHGSSAGNTMVGLVFPVLILGVCAWLTVSRKP